MAEEKKEDLVESVDQERFKEQIATKLGISKLPDTEKEKLIDGILSTLFQKILYGASEKLSSEDQEIFAQKLESIKDDADPVSSQVAIDAFFNQALPDYATYVAQTTQEFFDELDAFKGEMNLSEK